MKNSNLCRVGVDVGSTTLKIIILNPEGKVIYRAYRRHQADISGVFSEELAKVSAEFPTMKFAVTMTGSAGMGVSERAGIPFVQEVVSSVKVVSEVFPETKVLIDLGGEDAKMVFFSDERHPDIRMNGSCAGGTGAFIDQMADLMNVPVEKLGEMALEYKKIYPVASRCGVFAKTDVQNLLSRGIPLPDLSMSILHTVALQSITSLARGSDIEPQVLCVGGPLTFMPALQNAFCEILKLGKEQLIVPENSLYFPAWGAALSCEEGVVAMDLERLTRELSTAKSVREDTLEPLFESEEEYNHWRANRRIKPLRVAKLGDEKELECFLGIDSGSTTTKVVVIDKRANIVFSFYGSNKGNPAKKVLEGLSEFYHKAQERNVKFRFLSSAATGYGEDLIKSALGLDYGIVETMAHLSGAQYIDPNVSFVLDVGGQDMKSIFTHKGVISNVELNEACSSGCGSFLQNFASTMNLTLSEFTAEACKSQHPSDLGSRCTVFMNSKIKQSLREDATLGDVAAGLAYSVIKNCLFKVLKISNLNVLGDNIVVQGGTFRNDAVYRAIEKLSGKNISSTDKPELMGALGAALYAERMWRINPEDSSFKGDQPLPQFDSIKTRELKCKGCTNNCTVLQYQFANGNRSYAGNKCEKVFYNAVNAPEKGFNGFDVKNEVIFGEHLTSGRQMDESKSNKEAVPCNSIDTGNRITTAREVNDTTGFAPNKEAVPCNSADTSNRVTPASKVNGTTKFTNNKEVTPCNSADTSNRVTTTREVNGTTKFTNNKEVTPCNSADTSNRVTSTREVNDTTNFTNNKEAVPCDSADTGNRITTAREVNGTTGFAPNKEAKPQGMRMRRERIGIPRVLNTFEHFPFWDALFTECGYEVVLSPESTYSLYRRGVGSVMSDNICFPAKIVHGHIIALSESGVDRIFYPLIPKDHKEFKDAVNSYNCPVVSGYPDVVRSSMDPASRYGIPYDRPVITFNSDKAMEKSIHAYLSSLGVADAVIKRALNSALVAREKMHKELVDSQRTRMNRTIERGEMAFIVAGRPYHADSLINQKVAQILSDLGVNVFTDDVFRDDGNAGFEDLKIVSQWSYPNRVVQAAMRVAQMPENVQLIQLNSFGCGPDSFLMDEVGEILRSSGKNLTIIRIDEIASPGSIRLRLRSLIESLKAAEGEERRVNGVYHGGNAMRFTKADRDKTILIPWFSDFISPFVPSLGRLAGYKFENLPPSNKASAEAGLQYGNNEVCYPSTLVLGDIITTLQSGKYDIDDVVVAITQTGGQCRATNYIAQIKNGLEAAGFHNIPTVVLSARTVYQNEQSAFKLPVTNRIGIVAYIVLYADALQQMYNTTITREREVGETQRIFDKYIQKGIEAVEQRDHKAMLSLLGDAVREMNSVDIHQREFQQVGLVGEIFVKYNSYGQAHTTEWLRSHGVEVITPPLIDFLMQFFVNSEINYENGVRKTHPIVKRLMPLMLSYMNKRINKVEKIMSDFRFYTPAETVFTASKYASEVLSLSNQFGEGWALSSEVSHFARNGISKIVCVQPFGCIANHIVAKGVEKRIKQLYPEIDMLFLDIDGGMAEVNLQNRLHFML